MKFYGPQVGHGRTKGYACKRNPLFLLVGDAGFDVETSSGRRMVNPSGLCIDTHPRLDTPGPGLVGAGGDDRPVAATDHGYRFAAQSGVGLLLHGGEKGVLVTVDDRARAGHSHIRLVNRFSLNSSNSSLSGSSTSDIGSLPCYDLWQRCGDSMRPYLRESHRPDIFHHWDAPG